MIEDQVRGVLTMEFAWNKGKGGLLFFEHLAEKRLVGSRCESCKITSIPPRMFCGQCLKKTLHPVHLSDRGTVESSTVEASTGRMFVLVRIDGADNLFLHRFSGVGPPDFGMRVRVVWSDSRRGEITDVEGFEPDGT